MLFPILLLLILFVAIPIEAADYAVRFERLGSEDGLSSSHVRSILQDRRGYLWIATDYGLNQYDGYEFTVFEHEPNDSLSLAGSFIHSFIEDSAGQFWIQLAVSGVTRFDPLTGRAQWFTHDPEDHSSISPGNVLRVFEDSRGRVWIMTDSRGFDLYERVQERFVHFGDGVRSQREGRTWSISGVADDESGKLWLGTHGDGVLRFDPTTERWEQFLPTLEDSTGLDSTNITSLARAGSEVWIGTDRGSIVELDPKTLRFGHRTRCPGTNASTAVQSISPSRSPGVIWVSLLHDGLARYDSNTRLWKLYGADPTDDSVFDRSSLSSTYVSSMYEDRSGTLWVGTDRGGVFELNPTTEKFRWHRYGPGDVYTISPLPVAAIFEDRSGMLWFGTSGGGLSKYNPRQRAFSHDLYTNRGRNVLDGASVTAILEEGDDVYWIGFAWRGVMRFDRRMDVATHRFMHRADDAASLSSDAVTALYRSPSNSRVVWVGTTHGINRIDLGSMKLKRFVHDPEDSSSFGGHIAHCFVEDPDGLLWVGTEHAGLQRFDSETERFEHIPYGTDDRHATSHAHALGAHRTRDGTLWFGIVPGGLHRYDASTATFVRYTAEPHDPRWSFTPKSIYCMYEDHLGLLWLGTYSDGLVSLNRRTGDFIYYTQASGLPSNRIYSILPDDAGALWLSSDRGLAHFDPTTGAVTHYDHSDGLQNDEFLKNAACRASDGEFLFGGIDGMTTFFPNQIQLNETAPLVQLTRFFVHGSAEVPREIVGVSPGDSIVLKHDTNFVKVDFAALDFTNPAKNQYAYQLEGLDDDWVYCGPRRMASWSALNPGRYVLRVKASNNDGVWNEEGIAVAIIITPPFWATSRFYMLCATIIVGTILSIHRIRVAAETRQVRELEKVRHAEGSRIRKEAARDIHDELGHLVARISLFVQIARRELVVRNGNAAEYLQRIAETSKSLAEGLGDFVWTLDPNTNSVYEVIVRLKDFGDQLFRGTGVTFRVVGLDARLGEVRLTPVWCRHLTMMFKEAMTNILKHASSREVKLVIYGASDALKLTLADDGCGFDPLSPQPGTGLRNIVARAAKLGGRVDLVTSRGKGTTLSFFGALPGE